MAKKGWLWRLRRRTGLWLLRWSASSLAKAERRQLKPRHLRLHLHALTPEHPGRGVMHWTGDTPVIPRTPGAYTGDIFALASSPPQSQPYVLSGREGPDLLQLFLSPVDAAVGSLMLSNKTPDGLIILPVKSIHSDHGHDDTLTCLHIGYRAHNGQLLLSANGDLLPVTHTLPPGQGKFMNITINAQALRLFELIRELAGLYAWRESASAFFQWPQEQRQRTLQRSMETIRQGVVKQRGRFDQLAMFDPERMQWHFVCISDLSKCLAVEDKWLNMHVSG